MSNFKILILSLCLCITSCFPLNSPNTVEDVAELQTIVHDSCEYLKFRTYQGYYILTHKGNCTFCTQRSLHLESDAALTTHAIWLEVTKEDRNKGVFTIPFIRPSATYQVSQDGKNWKEYKPKSIDHE